MTDQGGVTLTQQEFDLLQAYIEKESSIKLDPDKTYLLESRLRPLLAEFDCKSYGDLYRLTGLADVRASQVRGKIVDAITTQETLWFRDGAPFTILRDVFLPEMARQVAQGKPKVRIWSAASSTGQEAYSIAMTIEEYCALNSEAPMRPTHFEIIGTDISTKAVSAARAGSYDNLSMNRGMSDAMRDRYFTQEGNRWMVNAQLKRTIEFQQFNLMSDFSGLGTFDVIFCRNVAIYFSHDFKVDLFRRMRKALRPGGLFFLGTSETLTYYNSGFESRDYQNHTYYVA